MRCALVNPVYSNSRVSGRRDDKRERVEVPEQIIRHEGKEIFT